MANEELVNYVRQYRGQFQDSEIREKMAAGGCPPEAIDAAFAEASGGQPGAGGTPEAAAEPETGEGMVLRRVLGVPLILLALGALNFGGAMTGPPLSSLVTGRGGGSGTLPLGLIIGGIGAAMLYGGIVLCRARAPEGRKVPVWEVLLAGLCFPGAAQAYAGRWLTSALFLFLPFLLLLPVLLGAALVGGDSFTGIANAVMPGKVFYALLWAGSLAEGYRWAAALPGGVPQKRIPRWPAAVAGLGLISYLFIFFLLMVVSAVGGILKVKVAAGNVAPDAQTRSVQGN